MVFSNIVIIEITILSRSLVFCASYVYVSAGLTNVCDLTIAAGDLIYCSLTVLGVVFIFDTR